MILHVRATLNTICAFQSGFNDLVFKKYFLNIYHIIVLEIILHIFLHTKSVYSKIIFIVLDIAM